MIHISKFRYSGKLFCGFCRYRGSCLYPVFGDFEIWRGTICTVYFVVDYQSGSLITLEYNLRSKAGNLLTNSLFDLKDSFLQFNPKCPRIYFSIPIHSVSSVFKSIFFSSIYPFTRLNTSPKFHWGTLLFSPISFLNIRVLGPGSLSPTIIDFSFNLHRRYLHYHPLHSVYRYYCNHHPFLFIYDINYDRILQTTISVPFPMQVLVWLFIHSHDLSLYRLLRGFHISPTFRHSRCPVAKFNNYCMAFLYHVLCNWKYLHSFLFHCIFLLHWFHVWLSQYCYPPRYWFLQNCHCQCIWITLCIAILDVIWSAV